MKQPICFNILFMSSFLLRTDLDIRDLGVWEKTPQVSPDQLKAFFDQVSQLTSQLQNYFYQVTFVNWSAAGCIL